MESVINGHQGPVPRGRIRSEENLGRQRKKLSDDPDVNRKRAKAREWYHANKERLGLVKGKHSKSKEVRVIPQENDGRPPVPKRPGKVDALICINRSLLFLRQGDTDGAELWSRFAARIIEGKE